MANLDGTGPLGQGPIGRIGRRFFQRKSAPGKLQGGSGDCVCPKCGFKQTHTRGVPCTQLKCPKCGTNMKGVFCA